jgi:hypothetical protein
MPSKSYTICSTNFAHIHHLCTLTPPSKFGGSPILITRSSSFWRPILVTKSSHSWPSTLIIGSIESKPPIFIVRLEFGPPILVARSSHPGPSTLIIDLVEIKPPILISRSLEFGPPISNARSLKFKFPYDHKPKDDLWITCKLHLSRCWCFYNYNVSTLHRSAHAFVD